jgi:hypothetical protein
LLWRSISTQSWSEKFADWSGQSHRGSALGGWILVHWARAAHKAQWLPVLSLNAKRQ